MTVIAPVKLHFEDSGEWYSLPEWAEYFISVGKQLASAELSDSRAVTAIVVPTRAFGAAFVSLGMVVSDAAARDLARSAIPHAGLQTSSDLSLVPRERPRRRLLRLALPDQLGCAPLVEPLR